MQEEKSILSKMYVPVSISDTVSAIFNKVTNSGHTMINGRIVKSSNEVGQISYNSKSGSLIVKVSSLENFTTEEQSSLFGSIPGYINEILTE